MIDTCIHHCWAAESDLHPFLEENWRAYVGRPGHDGPKPLTPRFRYSNPAGDDLQGARPPDGTPSGSSFELLRDRLLDGDGVERALLLFDRAMHAPALPNVFLATAVAQAINDWNLERWLSRDQRLHGVVLVPVQMPDAAAAEIRRVGQHPQIAGVLMGAGIGKLFGHPLYYPIYEAAVELDLPIVVHRGLDAIPETELSAGPAGGPPMTFAEYDTIAPLAVINQVMSLITNGVFTRYPALRVCVVGTGIAWVPGWLRRMELIFKALRREVPWVRRTPTEYFYEHVRVSTYGIERGRPESLTNFVSIHPELRELICYGSGFPSWDTTGIAEAESLFPDSWHASVFADNAERWFRWSSAPAKVSGAPSAPR